MIHSQRLTSAIVGIGALALLLAAVIPAEAVNCSSVCNQVRRACNHSAKGAYKAAKIQCDEDRDGCHADCDANAATCPTDCDAAASTCVADCAGDLVCEAACGDAVAQCQDDCVNCDANCDDARGQCRTDAKTDRDALRDGCNDIKGICGETCSEPIDKMCVRGCTSGEHGCRDSAKRTEGQCKKACAKDSGRKVCIRSCRKASNLAQQVCENTAVLCYAGCAGVDLTPTEEP
jgi:hypothetical protein